MLTIEHFGILFLALGFAGMAKVIFFPSKGADGNEVDLDLKTKVLKAKGPGAAIGFCMIMGGVFASGGTKKMVDYLFTSEAAAASLGNVVANKRMSVVLMSNSTLKPVKNVQVFPYFNHSRSSDNGEFSFNLPMQDSASGSMNFIIMNKGKKCADKYHYFKPEEASSDKQVQLWVDCE